nr:unnamed protein product [Digitaria exilis]
MSSPHCPRSLHGFSRLSRSCKLLSFSNDDDLPPPLQSSSRQNLRPQAQLPCGQQLIRTPPISLDNLTEAPISLDDVELLLPMFSNEETQALWSLKPMPRASPRLPTSRSVDQPGEKRKSPPLPSCVTSDDEAEVTSPPSSSPPPVKRARSKSRSHRRDAARAIRHQLRKWHGTIAARVLRRQFRAPELSRGGTALGCQCHELAHADGDAPPRGCALHQEEEHRDWLHTARGRVPLVGGPGKVLVPTMSAGNGRATYQRWRRGVRMPSRFYVEHAVKQGVEAKAAAERRRLEGEWIWMMTD